MKLALQLRGCSPLRAFLILQLVIGICFQKSNATLTRRPHESKKVIENLPSAADGHLTAGHVRKLSYGGSGKGKGGSNSEEGAPVFVRPPPSPAPTLPPQPRPSPFPIAPTFPPGPRIPCPDTPPGGCSVCGEGNCVTIPAAVYISPGQPDRQCSFLQYIGYAGWFDLVEECPIIPAIITDVCGCASSMSACPAGGTFTRAVVINFEGVLGEDLDSDQIIILEEAFLVAYNTLSTTLCPQGSFRNVVEVRIVDPELQQNRNLIDGDHRQLQFGQETIRLPFSVVVTVVYQCNSCVVPKLFGPDAVRRHLVEPKSRRDLQEDAFCETAGELCVLVSPNKFTSSFDDLVQIQVDANRLPAVSSVKTVFELEEVDCDENVVFPEVILRVDVTGRRADFTATTIEYSQEELAALEQGIRRTYNTLNGLNEDTCDPLFRRFVSVDTINADDFNSLNRRQLQFGGGSSPTLNDSLGVDLSLHLNIVLQCRGCLLNAKIFSNDAPRRRSMLASSSNQERDLQQTTESLCQCAIGADDFRPPTRDEFARGLNQTVQILIAEGEIKFITEVHQVAQIEEVSCPAQVDQRQSQVTIDVTGDASALSDEDIERLEVTIARSYNELTKGFCDPGQRTIIMVQFAGFQEISIDDEAVRQLQFNGTTTRKPFTLFFEISYGCRRGLCGKEGVLENDAPFRDRNLGSSMSSTHMGRGTPFRRLQSAGSACYCDVDVILDRAPTEEEFFEVLVIAIAELGLDAIDRVLTVSEPLIPVTFSPSSPPSPAPFSSETVSSVPSGAPSIRISPSAAPSGNPSTAPSLSSSPSAVTVATIEVKYTVAAPVELNNSFEEELIAAMDIYIDETLIADTLASGGSRRLQAIEVEIPTTIVDSRTVECPNNIPTTDKCSEFRHRIVLLLTVGKTDEDTAPRLGFLLNEALDDGDLQLTLMQVAPIVEAYYVKSVASLAPVVQTLSPTMAPVDPTFAPVVPTSAPISPSFAPVPPTLAPIDPTMTPIVPTLSPVVPTLVPVDRTIVPSAQPTLAPVTSSTLPIVPSPAPVIPTLSPVSPTLAPITAAPNTPAPTIPCNGKCTDRHFCDEENYQPAKCICLPELGWFSPSGVGGACTGNVNECKLNPFPCNQLTEDCFDFDPPLRFRCVAKPTESPSMSPSTPSPSQSPSSPPTITPRPTNRPPPPPTPAPGCSGPC